LHHQAEHNDHELLLLMANDDEDAFRRLYERYAPKVYNTAFMYLRSHIAAQDIVQDVFLKIWIKRASLKDIDNFNGWLSFVNRNTIIDSIRKKGFEEKFLSVQKEQAAISPEQEAISKETGAIIQQAIQSLPPRQQQIYQMAKQEGLKHAEIAQRLGLSTSTVKEHMKQALAKIRACLKDRLLSIFL
jgi:RNA polymerase sigma-70 factor (family 1)